MAHDIFIPKLGMTMEEATIAEWTVNDGDGVEKEQVILLLDTEKVTQEIESPEAGIIAIMGEPGEVYPCGAVVAKLAVDQSEYEQIKQSGASVEVKDVEAAQPETETAATEAAAPAPPAAAPTTGRIDISPVAKRIAELAGVDYSPLAGSGSGPEGRIVKKDVQKLIDSKPAEAAAASPVATVADTVAVADGKRVKEVVPLVGMRKTIAERMALSASTVARVTSAEEFDMGELIAYRKYYNEKIAHTGMKLTFTDFFILIVTKALKAAPIINSSLVGNEIRIWDEINIAFGVSVDVSDTEKGLVAPVIRDAGRMSLLEISQARKELMDKAREGKLSMDDMSGGTFTLTNTGTLSKRWHIQTPIINQPQVGILGTSPTVEKPVARDGEVVIRPILPVSFSFDHRVVDGEPVSKFMMLLGDLIEEPKMLLL